MTTLPRYQGGIQMGEGGTFALVPEETYGEPTERDWAEYMAWLDDHGGWPDEYPDEAPELPEHFDFEPSEIDRAWWAALSA